ncbi:hypothetical protein XfCFBP8356_011380 [Xylella fastidiosa subsp. sandyi]
MGVCCILLSVRALCLADVLAVLLGSVHEDAMAVGADGLGMTLVVMGCPRHPLGVSCFLLEHLERGSVCVVVELRPRECVVRSGAWVGV